MKKRNFYAGPSILNDGVIKNTAEAVLDFAGTGLSLMEVSHRGKEFTAVMAEARSLFKELLNIPDDFDVLFLGGGASLQFYQSALNFLKTKAAYLDTGSWAHKAIKEAKFVGQVEVVGSSEADGYTHIPDYTVPGDVDYFHYTTNNTIYGTEIRKDPEVSVPLIADMSSDIFTREIDWSKYICVYGGAQKNIAPAGVTFVVVKRDAVGKTGRELPTMLDYNTHIKKDSMFNTPPVLPVYVALQTMKWYRDLGGVKAIEERNRAKAEELYGAIDSSKIFRGYAKPEDRSWMNVTFVMKDEYKEKEAEFLDFATKAGCIGIKGYRTLGGFRASIYNGMDLEGVQQLTKAMKDFEKNL